MKNLYSKIALTVVLIAFALSSVACNNGDSNILTPDKGVATSGWALAMCVQDSGNNVDQAVDCLK